MIKIRGGSFGQNDTFVDMETKKSYRRIVAGLAWPGNKNGFVAVVAEDLSPDQTLNMRHLWVLAEAEDSSIDNLAKKCEEFRKEFKIQEFMGDMRNLTTKQLLMQANSRLKIRPEIYPNSPPHLKNPDAFQLYLSSLKNHLQKNTLHLMAGSKIPAYLMELKGEDYSKAGAVDYPAIAALGYAVACLDVEPFIPHEGFREKQKRRAESYGS